MIKKFWEYGKFKEYFAWAFENIFALIGTVLLVIATYYLKYMRICKIILVY